MTIFNNKVGALGSLNLQAGNISFSSMTGLISHYEKAGNNPEKKEAILKQMLEHPALHSKNLNSKDAQAFLKFAKEHKLEVSEKLSGPLNDSYKALPQTIKEKLVQVGLKIEVGFADNQDGLRKLRSLAKTVKNNVAQNKNDDASHRSVTRESRDARGEMKALKQEISILQNKTNRSSEEETRLKELIQVRDELKDAYRSYREMMHKAKIQTTELDDILVGTELFKPGELFTANIKPQYQIKNVDEIGDSKNVFNDITDFSDHAIENSIKIIRERMQENVVQDVLKEKKDFEKELQKITEKNIALSKEEAKKLDEKIDKHNAEINRLREKYAEIKKELQSLSKRPEITPKAALQIETLVKNLNKLDASSVKNIINKESFKADLKNFEDISNELVEIEKKTGKEINEFLNTPVKDEKIIAEVIAGTVAGLSSLKIGDNGVSNALKNISGKIGIDVKEIQRKLNKNDVKLFIDLEAIKSKTDQLLNYLKNLKNSGVADKDIDLENILRVLKNANQVLNPNDLKSNTQDVINELENITRQFA